MNMLDHIVTSLFHLEKRYLQNALKNEQLDLECFARAHGCELNMVYAEDWSNVHPFARHAAGYTWPNSDDPEIGVVIDYRQDQDDVLCAFEILQEIYRHALNYKMISNIWRVDMNEEARQYIAHYLAIWVLLLEKGILSHIV